GGARVVDCRVAPYWRETARRSTDSQSGSAPSTKSGLVLRIPRIISRVPDHPRWRDLALPGRRSPVRRRAKQIANGGGDGKQPGIFPGETHHLQAERQTLSR